MAFNITWTAYENPNITMGFANMTSYINATTNGYFGLGLLGVIWVTLFLVMRRWGDMEGVAVATFLTTVFAGIFWGLNLIPAIPFRALIIVTGLCFLIMWRRTK